MSMALFFSVPNSHLKPKSVYGLMYRGIQTSYNYGKFSYIVLHIMKFSVRFKGQSQKPAQRDIRSRFPQRDVPRNLNTLLCTITRPDTDGEAFLMRARFEPCHDTGSTARLRGLCAKGAYATRFGLCAFGAYGLLPPAIRNANTRAVYP